MYEKLRKEVNDYICSHKEAVLDYYMPFYGQDKYHDIEMIKKGRLIISPVFLSKAQNEHIEANLKSILELLDKMPELLFDNDYELFLDELGFGSDEKELFTKYRYKNERAKCLARPDYIYDGKKLSIMEFNVTSALGGILSNDLLGEEIYMDLFGKGEVFKNYSFEHMKVTNRISDILKGLKPGKENINVAITEWKKEFEDEGFFLNTLRRMFEENGLNASVCDPEDFRYENGLMLGDKLIDVIYRMFVCDYNNFLNNKLYEPMMKAVNNDEVEIISFLTNRIYSVKSNLALLSSAADSGKLKGSYRDIVHANIPWTRLLEDKGTSYNGADIDLAAYVAKNKDRFVLKPNALSAGRGVMVGKDHSQEEWEDNINKNIGLRNFIVQEFISPVLIDIPIVEFETKEISIKKFKSIFASFIINGKLSGYFVRCEDTKSNVINGSRGSLTTTAYVYSDRQA